MNRSMLYINTDHLKNAGICWDRVLEVLYSSIDTIGRKDFAQPVKLYLRYGDPGDRIIAMPAFLGGETAMAGIKWIASFPGNLDKGISRAHSVTVLNEADTGIPFCLFNTNLISGIRTAGVSGIMINEYLRRKQLTRRFTIAIIGFGPIGQLHLEMISSLLKGRIDSVYLYDIRGIDPDEAACLTRETVSICSTWEEGYEQADIVMTCTVSKSRYIDKLPKRGSLHLNVSLRDYHPEFLEHVDFMVVDDWVEVCRENTDVEVMHKTLNLMQADVHELAEVVCNDSLHGYTDEQVIMFNPMGMAIFDIAVGEYYYKLILERNSGIMLPG
ncbi:MAG TPA: hypothetical protein VNS58_08410 [Puia sp.]|nr:hypothetical protein [Puia sp.]